MIEIQERVKLYRKFS